MAIESLSKVLAGAPLSKTERRALSKLFSALRTAFLYGSATYDAASLADGAGATSTITVTGAALGDFVIVSAGVDLAGITCTGYVSAADTVSFRLQNETTGAVDLASTTFRAIVLKKSAFDASTVLNLLA